MSWRTAEDARRKKKQGEEEEQEQETRQIYKPGVERQKRQAAAEAVNASRREQAAKLGVGYLPGNVRVPGSPTQQEAGFTGDFRHDAMLADRRAQQQSAWDVAGVTQRVNQTINNGLGMMGLGQAPNSERDYMEMRRFYQLMEDAGRDSGNNALIDKARQGYGSYTTRLDDIERQRGQQLANAGGIDKVDAYYRMYQLAINSGDTERAEYARSMINSQADSYNDELRFRRAPAATDTEGRANDWQERYNRGQEGYVVGMMTGNQELVDRSRQYMEWANSNYGKAYGDLLTETQGPAAGYAYKYNLQELTQQRDAAWAKVEAARSAYDAAAEKANARAGEADYEWNANPRDDPTFAKEQEALAALRAAEADYEVWKQAIALEKGDEFAELEDRIPKDAAKTNRTPEGAAVRGQILKGQAAFRRHEEEAVRKTYGEENPGNPDLGYDPTSDYYKTEYEKAATGYAWDTDNAALFNLGRLRENGYSDALKQNEMGWGMTEDQKQTFYYLYAEDPAKAEEFAEACKRNAEDAYYAEMAEAETNPAARLWKEFKAANMKLIGGAIPFTRAGQKLTKEGTALAQSVGAGREKYGVMNTGILSGKLDEDIPIIGGKSLNDWTQLKSSMIMSGETAAAAKVAMATGHPEAAAIIEIAGLYMQSGAAANDDYIEMKRNGWSDNAALTHALFAGVAEATFEKVSLESLVNQNISRGFVRNLLTQGGIEASEEVATTIANHITDAAIARVNGYDNDRERRAKEYMGQGMSYNEAYNKADVDIMADLLDDALGGFLSGGLMSGGDYAVHGARTAVGKVTTGIRNTRSIYTGENLLGMGEDVNLHQGAAESVVNQVQNDSTGETTKALQAYAEANKISVKSKDSTRAVRANVEAVTDSIADKMYSKSETVDGRMEGAVAVYNETVQEYGEGIKPVAQAALRNTVNKIVTEASNRGNVSATTAFQAKVNEIQNPEARDVAQDALDFAVYQKTTNATQRSEVMEGFRHQAESGAVSEMRAQRTKARGDMTMKATVTDENGQSKAVDIVGITEDGKSVELSDGVKIAVRDLQTDADTKDAIQMIASMELGSNADKVLQAYRDSGLSGTEGYRYIADYTQAIEQGRTNRVSLERATKASSLDAKTVMDAYTIGQQIAHAETQKAMDRLKNAPKKKGATGRTARIDTSAIEGVTMSQSEREQFELANRIFTALGVDLRWVASSERNGRYVGANGSYLNGAVTLDIHAGRNFLNDIRSGILATTGHELTHFLQQYAPAQYKALKEFVFQQIVKNGKYGEETLERLVQEKKRRAKGRISQREAENEVVADACQNMLLDSKAVSRFAQEHEDAAKGIVRWLDKWFGKLKSAFTGSRLSEEARMMANLEKDVKQAFGELWDKALEEAVRMHDEIGDIESESEGQNSDRDTEYLEAVENDDMATAQKMVRAAAKKAGYNSPKLYHGSSAFGFTSFNMEKSFGQIFATTSIKTAKTYSGETKLMRLSDQVKLDVDALHGDALLEAANKYLDNRYDKFKLLTDTEKKAGLQKAQNNITKLAQKAAEFRQKRADRFDAELSGIYEKMTDALNRIASAQTEDDYEAAYKQYDDALWDFKWKDGNLFSQYIWDVPSKDVLNAYRDGSDFLYQGDLYRYTDTDGKWAAYLGNGLVFDNQMALELDAELHKGVYQLYGRMGKKLTIDANGANWNAIVTPEELHLDRPSKTRTIAEKAFALGYDSVEIKNVRDNSDGTDWRGISDVYIFNAKNAVKSADPVTYDDSGNVIPLSERFNTENQDIRYSERDELASDNQVHDITNRSGDTVGVQDGNGHVQFSQRTWRESGKEKMQEYLDERVRKYEANRNDPEGMHPDDAKALMDAVQEQYDALDEIVRQQPGNYKTYEEWADAEVETDIFGNPVFSWLKANGDYGISGDASLICVKRRTLDAVFDYMIQNNMIQDGPDGLKLAQESIVAINDIIRAHGFETACSTCYIDARRYRAAIVAGSFCNVYNKLVRSMLKGKTGVPINAFNFGGNKSVTPLANSLDTLSDSEINWDGINKAIRDQEAKWESKGWEKFTEDGEEKWRRNGTVKNLPTSGTTEYRIALALKEKPSLRKLALRSDFLSGNGFLELNRTNKDILTLYNVKKGQAGPKATETDIQYLHEALENSFITPERMFKAGGFRLQSFSDYVPRLVFDYVEIIGDLSAKGVPAHMYTKEILCVLQHGLTGTKINMSLIPAMVKKGIAPGLDADGNYLWRDGQTFGSTAYSLSPKLEAHLSKILGYQVKGRLTGAQGFELAKLIQNDPAYGKNNGTIAIGVSEAQIRKMLDDADIRMVIPYHKSGLNHILASMMEIPGFENYESYQNTLKWNGTKWAKVDMDFDFNEAVQKHKGDARAAAQDYLDWCEENGYKPKFSGVASGSARNSYNKAYDFTQHADWQTGTMTGEAESNYYKVLADFTCYDAEGKVSRQEAVKLNYPGTDSAFGSMKQLIEMGLESDAMLQAKQDAEVPKIVADIVREIPKFEAAGRNMKAYAQLKENVEGRQMSERSYDTPSDMELLEGIDESGLKGDEKAQVREAKQKQQKIRNLERQLARVRNELKGLEGDNPSRLSVKDFTRNVLDLFGIPTGSRTEVGEMLQSIAQSVLSGQQLSREDAAGFFSYFLSQGKGRTVTDESLAQIRDELKGRKIYVNQETRADFGDDWNAFRKRAFGLGIQLTSNENNMGVDSVNAELAEMFPGSFDAEATDLRSMLENMVETAESGKSSDVSLLETMEETAKQTGEPVQAQLQSMMDSFLRHLDIMQDRARIEAKARAGNAQELAKFKNRAAKAAAELSKARKERNDWKRKATGAEARQAKAVDRALRGVIQHDAKQLAEAVRQKKALSKKLEMQLQREEDILAGKLTPPAMQRMLKDARDAQYKKDQEAKEAQFAGYKDRRKRTELRKRIRNIRTELANRIAKPTDRVYVPAALAQSLVYVLDTLDASPKEGTKAAEKYASVSESLRELARAYGQLSLEKQNEIPWEFKSEYQEDIAKAIEDLEKTMQGRNLRELSADELQQVYDVVKRIRDTMQDATKLIGTKRHASIYEAGESVIDNQRHIKALKNDKSKAGRALNRTMSSIQIDALSAMRAALMMGGFSENAEIYQLMKDIEDGYADKNRITMEAAKRFQDLRSGKNAEEYLKAMRNLNDYGIKDTEGRTVKLTKMQAMQILMTWQREQANDRLVHMTDGGIIVRDADLVSKGKFDAAEQAQQTVKVTPEMIANINSEMTAWDKAYMQAARDTFDSLLKQSNEVLYALKKKVHKGEKNYIPERVANNYLQQEVVKGGEFNLGVKEAGATKDLVQRSTLPIIIDGLETLLNHHVNEMANYIGMAVPIRNFAKVYNMRTTGIGVDATTVNAEISKTWGKKAGDMLMDTLREIQNGRTYQYNTAFNKAMDKLQNAFVKASLVGKISVTIKQAASYAAAGSVLSQRALDTSQQYIAALLLAPNSKMAQNLYKRMDSRTPEYWIRRQGLSMEEIAIDKNRRGLIRDKTAQAGAWLEGKGKAGQFARRNLTLLNPTNWIQRVDVATTGALAVACEKQARYDGYKPGTAEYEAHVTELYERVIRETQPMYDALHRPEFQKNAPTLIKMTMPFRTVPFQNYGQIMVAAGQFQAAQRDGTKAEKIASAKHLGKTLWANFESAAIFAFLTLLTNAIMHKPKKYLDDDDELTLESVLKAYGSDVLDVSLGNLMPYGGTELKDLVERWINGDKWYDVISVGTVDLVNTTAKSVLSLHTAGDRFRDGEIGADDLKNTFLNTLMQVTKMMGLPVSNLKDIYSGISADVNDLAQGKLGIDRSNSVNARRYYKAWMAGDNAKVRDVLKEMRDSGKSEDAIKNAISKQAKTAYEEGNIDIDQYAELLDRTGYWDEEKLNEKVLDIVRDEYVAGARTEKEAVDLLIRYNAKVENEDDAWKVLQRWETNAEHKGDEDYHYSEYEDLIKDLDAGKTFDEAAAAYLDHGYEEKNLRSNAVSHTKELYQAGKLTDDEAIDQILDYAWKKEDGAYRKLTENEAWMKIKEWRESAGHEEEEDYHYTQYDAIDEAITAGQDIKGLVNELTDHGVKADNVTSHIKGYLIEQYIAGNSTEAKLKNQLSKYLGLTGGEDRDEIVRDANCKKLTGYDYGNLGKGYKAGKIPSQTVTKALTQYGGMSSSDVKARVRYWDFQKSYPDSNLGQTTLDKYYDTTIENVGRTLQGSGLSLDTYVRYAEAASKAKGTDKDGDGKTDSGSKKAAIMQIIDNLNLTTAQKDALYYFNGWSAKTIKEAPWH